MNNGFWSQPQKEVSTIALATKGCVHSIAQPFSELFFFLCIYATYNQFEGLEPLTCCYSLARHRHSLVKPPFLFQDKTEILILWGFSCTLLLLSGRTAHGLGDCHEAVIYLSTSNHTVNSLSTIQVVHAPSSATIPFSVVSTRHRRSHTHLTSERAYAPPVVKPRL